ncbi:glycosyltransferase [Geminicoccus roseus]|uniref:glycosyltransferase n=1 Tax=Geminicoccus roseus TaxID=404900 RepID=UPI00040CB8FF|nr:glycosyltransferase [Geminicoccus roseus]
MRYLWLTRATPYPPHKSGDIAYARGLIENLAPLAPVQVLSLRTAEVRKPAIPGVAWNEVDHVLPSRQASIASRFPQVASQNVSRPYLRQVREAAAEADAIVVDNLAMAWCIAPLLRHLGPKRPPVVLVNHNFETALRPGLRAGASSPVLKAVLAWDGWKAARLERAANRAVDGFTAITEADLAALRDLAPGKPAHLLMPGYGGIRQTGRTISAATPRRVAIIGGRGTFYKKMILSNLLRALQAAGLQERMTIDVVGGGLDGEMEQLRREFPGFHFIGYVDDLAEYLGTARLGIVADTIGGGFKIRALDHVFLRLPMLALEAALSGMRLRPGLDFVAARDLDELIAQLPGLIDDPARLDAVQNAAFARYAPMFDWAERMRGFHDFVGGLRRP